MLRTNRKTRSGFTLVELMIAAAITVMIMTILSICFQTSMSAMSSMRAQGDAADQLRALGTTMKRDFNAERHLPAEGSPNVLNRGRRASDHRLDLTATPTPPATGFLHLDSPPSTNEGSDGVFNSYMSAPNATYPTGSRIWMTSVQSGGDDSKLYTATVNGVTYSSEAAEVAYFLVPMGQNTSTDPVSGTSTPLFSLHRRQRLVAIDSARQAALMPAAFDQEVISTYTAPGPVQTPHTMTTIASTAPVLRPAFPTPLTGARFGDDIILSYVISMDVKPTWTYSPTAFGFRDPVPFNGRGAGMGSPAYGPNHDFPYDDLTKATNNAGQFTFDTLAPMQVRMNAMQVRIRIYDPKVKTARQMTLIVDL